MNEKFYNLEKILRNLLKETEESADPVFNFMSALDLFSIKTNDLIGVYPLSYFTIETITIFTIFACF